MAASKTMTDYLKEFRQVAYLDSIRTINQMIPSRAEFNAYVPSDTYPETQRNKHYREYIDGFKNRFPSEEEYNDYVYPTTTDEETGLVREKYHHEMTYADNWNDVCMCKVGVPKTRNKSPDNLTAKETNDYIRMLISQSSQNERDSYSYPTKIDEYSGKLRNKKDFEFNRVERDYFFRLYKTYSTV